MGYRTLTAVVRLQSQLSNNEFRVMSALSNFHNQLTGRCCPSYERLATETGLSRRTVARTLVTLKQRELISWVTVKNGTSEKHNEYILLLDQVPNSARPSAKTDQTKCQNTGLTKCQLDGTGTEKRNREVIEQRKNLFVEKENAIILPFKFKEVEVELPMLSKEQTDGIDENKRAIQAAEEIRNALISQGRKVNNLSSGILKGTAYPKWFCNLVEWISANSQDWIEQINQLTEEIENNTVFTKGYNGWLPDLGWLFTKKDGELGIDRVFSGRYNHMRKENLKAREEAEAKKAAHVAHVPSAAKLTGTDELRKQGFSVFDGNE
jgi:hypothetical protein